MSKLFSARWFAPTLHLMVFRLFPAVGAVCMLIAVVLIVLASVPIIALNAQHLPLQPADHVQLAQAGTLAAVYVAIGVAGSVLAAHAPERIKVRPPGSQRR